MKTQYMITSDDIKLIEKLIDIKNRGLLTDGSTVTNIYNKVLDKRVTSTNCSSCIRARIQELENWLKKQKAVLELEVKNDISEEKEEPTVAENKPKTKGVSKKKK